MGLKNVSTLIILQPKSIKRQAPVSNGLQPVVLATQSVKYVPSIPPPSPPPSQLNKFSISEYHILVILCGYHLTIVTACFTWLSMIP